MNKAAQLRFIFSELKSHCHDLNDLELIRLAETLREICEITNSDPMQSMQKFAAYETEIDFDKSLCSVDDFMNVGLCKAYRVEKEVLEEFYEKEDIEYTMNLGKRLEEIFYGCEH